MPQRVIKIILPENHGEQALELLEHQDNLIFWLEESSGSNFVASALTDSGRSETIMDLFEKIFSSIEGFRLILFPVEASIPRTDTDGEDVSAVFSRYGVTLIAEKLEDETSVVQILEYDIPYGQGHVFGAPRPIKSSLMQETAPPSEFMRRLASVG